jgi:hypothetical protein
MFIYNNHINYHTNMNTNKKTKLTDESIKKIDQWVKEYGKNGLLTRGDQFLISFLKPEASEVGEIMLYALKSCESAREVMEHTHPDLRANLEFMREATRINPSALAYAEYAVKNDLEFMKEVVRQDGSQLANASEQLRNNRELAEMAIGYDMRTYTFLSKNLKADKNIVLKTIQSDSTELGTAGKTAYLPALLLVYFPDELRTDLDVLKNCSLVIDQEDPNKLRSLILSNKRIFSDVRDKIGTAGSVAKAINSYQLQTALQSSLPKKNQEDALQKFEKDNL